MLGIQIGKLFIRKPSLIEIMASSISIGVYTSTISGVGGKRKPKSFKTTVRTEVVKALELKSHDKLDWDIRVEGSKKYVIVTKHT